MKNLLERLGMSQKVETPVVVKEKTTITFLTKKYEKIVHHFRLRPHANLLATKNISYATKTLHSPK